MRIISFGRARRVPQEPPRGANAKLDARPDMVLTATNWNAFEELPEPLRRRINEARVPISPESVRNTYALALDDCDYEIGPAIRATLRKIEATEEGIVRNLIQRDKDTAARRLQEWKEARARRIDDYAARW